MTRAKTKTAKGYVKRYRDERNIYEVFNRKGDSIGFSVRVGSVRVHAPGQTRGTFQTLDAAKKARDNYKEQTKDGIFSQCHLTLNEVFQELYEKGADSGNKSANTQLNQHNFYYNYIEPILNGNREIREFTRDDIKNYRVKIMRAYGVKTGKPLSQGTKRAILVFVFQIFRFALHEGYINTDICMGIDLPRAAKAKKECLSPEQMEILTKDVNERFPFHLSLYAGFYLLSETGARPSEICGLRWCDVDLNHSIVYIQQQINRATKKPGRTKTPKSVRKIYLTPVLHTALSRILEYRKKTGIKVKDTDYIITNTEGKYTGGNIAYSSLSEIMRRFGRRCGIKITSKTFRKTVTTRMLEAGVPPMVVARHLGHTTTRMIETVYGDTDTLYQNAFPLMGKDRRNVAVIECA